jgi:hypothetical protein
MADNYSIDMAVSDLDELTAGLLSIIQRGGFDPQHKGIIWLIKGWIKIAILANHPSYGTQAAAYFVMKRDPAPYKGSRSKALLRDLESFQTVMERDRTTEGDFFNRVDAGMRDLVWEYRKRLSGKSAADFETKLQRLLGKTKDDFLKEAVFAGDQHL